MSQTVRAGALGYVNIIITTLVGLLITPFIIRSLGNSEYGLYTLIGSLVATLTVLDLGLGNTIVRFVAQFRVLRDRRGEENFLFVVIAIYFVLSIIIVAIGALIYPFIGMWLSGNLSSGELQTARLMFIVLIANLAITLPGGSFSAVCTAYECFVWPRVLSLIKYILRTITIIAILSFGGGALAIVVIDTAFNITFMTVIAFFAYRRLGVRVRYHGATTLLLGTIFRYSSWVFLIAVVGQIQWNVGQVILGATSGPVEVAIYGVGIMLGTYYAAFGGAISSLLLPRATQMSSAGASGDALTEMMVKAGRPILIVMLAIFGGFYLFGRQFVDLWVGEVYSESWAIGLVVMTAYTLPLIQAFANSLLEARGMFALKAIVYLLFIGLGTGVGAFLLPTVGKLGLVICASLGWLIGQLIVNVYFSRALGLNLGRFFAEVAEGILVAFIASLLVGLIIDEMLGGGWLNLGLKVGLFSLVYMFLMTALALRKEEMSMVRSLLPERAIRSV